jgi:hypothetical protein
MVPWFRGYSKTRRAPNYSLQHNCRRNTLIVFQSHSLLETGHFQELMQPFTFLQYTGKVTYVDVGQEEYEAEFRAPYRTTPPMLIRLNLHRKASKDRIRLAPPCILSWEWTKEKLRSYFCWWFISLPSWLRPFDSLSDSPWRRDVWLVDYFCYFVYCSYCISLCMTHSVSFLDSVFSWLGTIVLSLVALWLTLHILPTHHPYSTHTRLLSLLSFLHCFPCWTMRSHHYSDCSLSYIATQLHRFTSSLHHCSLGLCI